MFFDIIAYYYAGCLAKGMYFKARTVLHIANIKTILEINIKLNDMEIFQPTQITEEIVNAFKSLIPQLSPHAKIPTQEELEAIVANEDTVLFIAKDQEIVGSLTLAFYKIPTGGKAWIEDVVVDSKARGLGLGEKLMQHAMDYAAKKGYTKIDLTSAPERVAANQLYQKLGFKRRETNVYRWEKNKAERVDTRQG